MDEYFSHFCPYDVSAAKRREVNAMLNDFEITIFDRLPWLLNCSEEEQNDVIKCVFDARVGVL